jgi:hypothetical protein
MFLKCTLEMWPGYGGLIYYGQNDGHIIDLKVLPNPLMQTQHQKRQPVDVR